jgi:hypothetical protein
MRGSPGLHYSRYRTVPPLMWAQENVNAKAASKDQTMRISEAYSGSPQAHRRAFVDGRDVLILVATEGVGN